MEVLKVEWFQSILGVVLAKNTVGEINFYVGQVLGIDEEEDIQFLLEHGNKINPQSFFNSIESFKKLI